MLLTLDVGNTQTVVGVFDELSVGTDGPRADGEIPGLLHHWRVATLRDRTPDELALVVRGLTALAELEMPMFGRTASAEPSLVVDGLAISSSVPTQTAALREMAARYFDAPCVIVEPGIKTGIPILYDDPREVGADRISNAVAALDLYEPPTIVVDLGTATTFDVISGAREYLGGAIVPGIEISMDALFDRAEALRRVELREPRHVVGRTTVESMQSGAIYGYSALVDGLCRRIEKEIGTSTIVATGGLSALIGPYAESVAHIEPWLTLHGLRLIYLRNIEGGAAR